MSVPARFALDGTPDPNGPAVLFADVEDALEDRARLQWLLPMLDGSNNAVAEKRTAALLAMILLGKKGIALVDEAMRVCDEG